MTASAGGTLFFKIREQEQGEHADPGDDDHSAMPLQNASIVFVRLQKRE
jgi:hypothetical protein